MGRLQLLVAVGVVALSGSAWAPPPPVTWTETMGGHVTSEDFGYAVVRLRLRCGHSFVGPSMDQCSGRYRCTQSNDQVPGPCKITRGSIGVEQRPHSGSCPELDAGGAALATVVLQSETPSGGVCRFDGYTQDVGFAIVTAVGRYTCTSADGIPFEQGRFTFALTSHSRVRRVGIR